MRTIVMALVCACATAVPTKPTVEPAPASEHMVVLRGPAGTLRVSDGGAGGIPVVFVHGLGGDLEVWRGQLDHLRPTRRAIAMDLRGHGQSAAPADGTWTVDALADDLDAVIRGLALDRVILVGHSYSGCVLQVYAARHPEKVAALVYVDAVGTFAPLGHDAIEQMIAHETASIGLDPAKQRDLIAQYFDDNTRPATKTAVLAALHLAPEGFAQLRAAGFRFSPPVDPAASGIPLFAIEVARTEAVPILFSHLAPSAALITIPHVSHWLMLDDPAAFDTALDSVLARVR